MRSIAWHHVRESAVAADAIRQAKDRFRTAVNADDQRAALEFLATAAPDDALECARQALSSPRARVRAAALAVLLSKAAPADQEPLLLAGLKDPAGRVQAVAVQAIFRGAWPPPGDAVVAIARAHGSVAALRRAFDVLSRTSSWERLLALLAITDGPLPPGGRELCADALLLWQRDDASNFVPLGEVQRTQLLTLHRRMAATLPASLGAHLEFLLR